MSPNQVLAVFGGVSFGIVLAAFLPWSMRSSQAGTAVRMDIEEMVHASDLVVEGRVLDGRSRETERGAIVTDWEIQVDRTFVGDELAFRTVSLPGGVLPDGKGMVVPGMPSLSPGEDVVLLLSGEGASEEERKAVQVPTGLAQGKYRIVTDAHGGRKAVRTGEHLTLATASSGALGSGGGLAVLEYTELVSRLEAAAQVRRATSDEPSDGTEADESGR